MSALQSAVTLGSTVGSGLVLGSLGSGRSSRAQCLPVALPCQWP